MLPRPKRFELAKVLTIYLGHSRNVRDGVANPVPLGALRKKHFVKTHALSLLGTTRLLSRSDTVWEIYRLLCRQKNAFLVSWSLYLSFTGDGAIGAIEEFMSKKQIQKCMA